MAHRLAAEAGVTWWAMRDQVTIATCIWIIYSFNRLDLKLFRRLSVSQDSGSLIWRWRRCLMPETTWSLLLMTSHMSEKPWRNTSRSDCGIKTPQSWESSLGKSRFSLLMKCVVRKNAYVKKHVQFISGVRFDGHAAAPLQELPEVPLCRFLQDAGWR